VLIVAKNKNNIESFEQKLLKAANKLRKNIDLTEFKYVVLGIIFLRYISDTFEDLYEKLKEGEGEYSGADPENIDEYRAKNVFYVPTNARWQYLKENARNPEIGKILDEAMELIEKENPSLKGVFPKVYSKENIDPISLGEIIDLFSNFDFEQAKERRDDILGYVYEYLLGKFSLEEGRKGGQFYTPRSIIELLVEMLEPYQGIIFDPCCGSGGMFIQSAKFVKEHQRRINDISIYGQEINQTAWRICKMNLIIRGIDASQVKWNPEGSFLNDAHKDLKADFVITNPPFNDRDWGGELLLNDVRWKYGIPPINNANYAWIQHFIHHLNIKGKAGFVHSKDSLTTIIKKEYEIKKNLIEADLVECIVNLPDKLFLNTHIPVCLWLINKDKKRKGQILFIDAGDLGELINRRTRILKSEDIRKIADTYHEWQKGNDGNYQDLAGFCKSAFLEEVKNLDYVLNPSRYVGLPDKEDDFDFEELFTQLKAEFIEQLKEEESLNKLIVENLTKIDLANKEANYD